MNRRSFFGTLAGVAAAATTAKAVASSPFQHVAYGPRPGTIDPYVEWRGHAYWIDERDHRRFSWACPRADPMMFNRPDYNWIALQHPITQLVPSHDRLWLLTVGGWYDFTYDGIPTDNTARVQFVMRT